MTAELLAPPRLTACPYRGELWARIDFCPLYIESHVIRPGAKRSFGCVDDIVKPCKVHRGKMDFVKAIERIRKIDPRFVSSCEFRVDAEDVREKMRKRGDRQ